MIYLYDILLSSNRRGKPFFMFNHDNPDVTSKNDFSILGVPKN